MIAAAGLPEPFICNVVSCRPPSNRTPSPGEVTYCSDNLAAQLALAAPYVVVLLGATALKAFNPDGRITRDRGRPFNHNDMIVLPTFHPAYVLRNPAAMGDVVADLIEARRILCVAEVFGSGVQVA